MNSIQITTITVFVSVTLVVWWIDNISEESSAPNVKVKPNSWDGEMYDCKETDGCERDSE